MRVLKDFLTAAAIILGTLAFLALVYFVLLMWWWMLEQGGHPVWAVVEGVGAWTSAAAGGIAAINANHRYQLKHHPERFDEHGEPLRGKGYVRAGARAVGPPPPKAPRPHPMGGGYTPSYPINTDSPPPGISQVSQGK